MSTLDYLTTAPITVLAQQIPPEDDPNQGDPTPGGGGFENPLEKVTPSFSWLGPSFDGMWVRVVAVIWMFAIVWTAVNLILAFSKVRAARKGGYTNDLGEATGDVQKAAFSVGGVIGAPIIVGAIIYMFS